MNTTTKLEDLRTRLVGRNVGGTTIVDARPEFSESLDGEELTRVWLLLTPPRGETWPVEVIRELRRVVQEEVQKLELPGSFMRFSGEGDEGLNDLEPDRAQLPN